MTAGVTMDSFCEQDTGMEALRSSLPLQLPDNGKKPGEVLMTLCLNLTLFFENAFEADTRQAILDMLSDYQRMMGDRIHFTTNPQTGNWKDLRKKPYMTPHDWLPRLPDEQWEFIYHGGAQHRDASDIRFDILAEDSSWHEGAGVSWLTINFPLTFFADWPESFQDLALRWIGRLQPRHGYAAIATTHNHFDDYRHEPLEFQLAQRYPGLDISNHIRNGRYLTRDTIKGINWQTILHDELLEQVGGLAALQRIPGLTAWQAGDIWLIQASERPALATIPDSYYALGALLEPIRDKNVYTVHHLEKPGEVFYTGYDYEAWLARFDRRPPPASDSEETPETDS